MTRRLLVVLAVAAFLFGCGKPQAPKVDDAKTPAAPKLVVVSSPTAAGLPVLLPPELLPSWTKAAPAIVAKGSRRYARAVGSYHAGDLALSRSAAEDRARASIAKLLYGQASLASEEVTVTGAQITRTFTSRDGTVFVELSAPVHR